MPLVNESRRDGYSLAAQLWGLGAKRVRMGGPTGYLLSSPPARMEESQRPEVGCPQLLLSSSTVKHRTDSRMGFPQPLRVFAAPYCAGPWASLLRPQPPSLYPFAAASTASHFSTSLCAAGDVPRAPTDPPKFTSALGARLPGGLGKEIPEFLRGCAGGGGEWRPRRAGRGLRRSPPREL